MMTTTYQPQEYALTDQERQLLRDLGATGAYIERVYGRYFLRLKLIPQYRKLLAGALVGSLMDQGLLCLFEAEGVYRWPAWRLVTWRGLPVEKDDSPAREFEGVN